MTVKKKRGRPAGVKDSYQRTRSTNAKLVQQAEKKGRISKTYLKMMEQLRDMAAQNEVVAEKFGKEHQELLAQLRRQRYDTAHMARQVDNEVHGMSSQVELRTMIPMELAIMFREVVKHSPFTKSEILNNLILNFVKAYRGLSKAELERLRTTRLEIEKRQYEATVVAGNYIAKNPERIITQESIHGNAGRKRVAAAVHEDREVYREYALSGDQPLPPEEIAKALETQGFITYDDLWKDD